MITLIMLLPYFRSWLCIFQYLYRLNILLLQQLSFIFLMVLLWLRHELLRLCLRQRMVTEDRWHHVNFARVRACDALLLERVALPVNLLTQQLWV